MNDMQRTVRTLFAQSLVWFKRLIAFFSSQKNHLYTDRFATKAEVQTLVHDTSFGLVLGVDASGRELSIGRPRNGRIWSIWLYSDQPAQEKPGGRFGN